MLLLSKAKVTVDRAGRVTVEGLLAPHAARIRHFLEGLGLERAVIRYRFGRYVFSPNIDPATQQRLRNFLHSECPLKP